METEAPEAEEARSTTENGEYFDTMVKVGAAAAIVGAGIYLVFKFTR